MNKEDNIRTSKAAVIIVLYQPQKTDIDKVSLMADRYAGVIIDNSQENTFKQENVGLMHYIPLHENKGIAEAQNIGLQYIFNHTDATHIVFLDQDSDVPATYVDDIVNLHLTRSDRNSLIWLSSDPRRKTKPQARNTSLFSTKTRLQPLTSYLNGR